MQFRHFISIFTISILCNINLKAQEPSDYYYVEDGDTIYVNQDEVTETVVDDENNELVYEEKEPEKPLNQHDFNQSQWQKTIAGLDYSSKKTKKKPEPTKKTKKEPEVLPDLDSLPAMMSFFKWFIILAAVALLGFLAYQFLKEGGFLVSTGRKINATGEIDLNTIEENIHESDFDKLIYQTIAQGNYRLAIRLYYLAILKELSLRNFIDWKRNKTNRIYLREMENNRLFPDFKETTIAFERIWYGNDQTTFQKEDFDSIEPQFRRLLNNIR